MQELFPILSYLFILIVLGLAVWPLSQRLFRGFSDRGWLFSQILGLILSAYILWVLNSYHILPFSGINACICVFVIALLNYGVYFALALRKIKDNDASVVVNKKYNKNEKNSNGFHNKNKGKSGTDKSGKITNTIIGALRELIPPTFALKEEAGFIVLFLLVCYILGFNPWVKDTEKFMDYGFLTSMNRSSWMPFPDMWLSGEPINYYYGGQYLMAFLMKLSATSTGYAYNLMRALLTTATFFMPFSLGWQFWADRSGGNDQQGRQSLICASLSGTAVAFAANGHYLLYGIIQRALNHIALVEDSYFYPDPSRFMSSADGSENLAHEFPAYSSILGDIHAHYINLILVFLIISLLYAWSRERLEGRFGLLDPWIILMAFLNGLFRWTNFWDMPIYFVVCGAVILFTNISSQNHDFTLITLFINNAKDNTYNTAGKDAKNNTGQISKGLGINYKRSLIETAIQGLCFIIIGTVAALPFTFNFQMISSEVLPTHSHSSLGRLAVVWLLPFAALLGFLRLLYLECANDLRGFSKTSKTSKAPNTSNKKTSFYAPLIFKWFRSLFVCSELSGREGEGGSWKIHHTDRVLLLFGLCAAGLVLLPEFVYVKDIYEGGSYRFNTMFKLTYQAFVLFALFMGYFFSRLLYVEHSRGFWESARRYGKIGVVLLLLHSEYIVYSVNARFGNVLDISSRRGLDAHMTFEEYYPDDISAIEWINSEICDQPVMLEAPGLSYTDYERISVSTGLPTVVGWHTHEHLWRDDQDMVIAREGDVDKIYGGQDVASETESVRQLLEKYNVSYIYIGPLEREKYPMLNDAFLESLGSTVFENETSKIIYVQK